MATVKLGYVPNRGALVLSEGADFVCSLQEVDNGVPVVWPEDTTCRLEFPTLDVDPIEAVVTEATGSATFILDKTATTATEVPDNSPFHIYLVKDEEFLWFHGKVDRKERGNA